MRVRITKALPAQLEGFDVRRFTLDGAYDIQVPLCDVIILSGYGIPEDEPPVDRALAIKALADAITPKKAVDIPAALSGKSRVTPNRRRKRR
jgi:hypothetical protein